MPIGIIIIAIIVIVLLGLWVLSKLDFNVVSNIEAVLSITFVVVVGGVIVYVIILSFFDNEAAIKLLNDFFSNF